MTFLIAIVFIAQIIIFVNIVTWAVVLDNKVRVLSAKIEQDNEKLEKRFVAIREITEVINEIVASVEEKVVKKRNRYILKWLKTILQGTVLVFFKPKYRKIFLGVKLGMNLVRDLSKSENML